MKKISEEIITNINKILVKQTKTVILGHYNPDGDAMGACTGLYNFLTDKVEDLHIIMPSAHADNMNQLPKTEDIITFEKQEDKVKEIILNAGIIFCIDFNHPSRVGDKMRHCLEDSKAVKVLLDHHPDPDSFAEYIISDTTVSSASEIIYEFIKLLDADSILNLDTATCLFTGIMADTICFSVNSSTKRTFEIASELIALGINKDKIYDNVYNNYSLERMKLYGYMLDNKLEILSEVNIAYLTLSISEQKKYNFKHGDSDGFVNAPLSIAGVKACVFFMEKEDMIKISFRSKDKYDVNSFSKKYFNGGGHKKAAGGKLFKMTLDDAVKYFKKKAVEFFGDN